MPASTTIHVFESFFHWYCRNVVGAVAIVVDHGARGDAVAIADTAVAISIDHGTPCHCAVTVRRCAFLVRSL